LKKIKGIKKYAKLFLNAIDIDEAPRAIEQLSAISNLMEKDRGFRNLMVSPAFDKSETLQIIDFLAKKLAMADKTAKYLQYLFENKAIIAMPEIVEAIIDAYLESKNKAKAVVISAIKTEKEYEERLRNALKQITGKDIDIDFVVDPSLLGGVRIKVGSTMYDSSIKGQLELLKERLLD
jgi:F-type H+-transporting ATPase subunit delta